MAAKKFGLSGSGFKAVKDVVNDHAAAIDALITDFATLIAKMNLDSGVGDADYAQASSAALDGDTLT